MKAPIRIAAAGTSIIFKSPNESNNCGLLGGAVTFEAKQPGASGKSPFSFLYDKSMSGSRGDVVELSVATDQLALSGSGAYRFGTSTWRRLAEITHRATSSASRSRISIRPSGSGAYSIQAASTIGTLFRATVLPEHGHLYIRDGLFSDRYASYVGHSEHDCGNWDTADEASKALARVQSRIPR